MIEITHPKVASLKPEWAPFGGCTLIFERFGRSGGGEGDAQALHGTLADALAQVPEHDWRALAFCPLPVESLHVTLADLLHQGNLKEMPDTARTGLIDVEGRIDPLRAWEATADLVAQSQVLAINASGLRFRLGQIGIRNQRVIAAELIPDMASGSQATLRRLVEARDRLSVLLAGRFGVTAEPWTPHIMLGYLANRDLVRQAAPLADRIDALLRPTVRQRSFGYGQPRAYTFTDMARFDPVADA